MGNKGRLRKSLRERRMVRIKFEPKHIRPASGYVVALGDSWGLLAMTMDGGYFDGYRAFRLSDIRRARWDTSFESRFAATRPEWPPVSPEVDLGSTARVIESLAASFPLVSVEHRDGHGLLWIGRPLLVGPKRVVLHEVRPDGTWYDEPHNYTIRPIFSVEVGTHYLVALNEVCDPRPDVRPDLVR